MENTYSVIITTCSDKESATAIAKILIENKLAACVNILPIESIYVWQDEICDDKEIVLFIKSKSELFNKIKAIIKENHLYEIPEIIEIPISDGLPEYLRWIDDNTKK